MRLRKSSTGTNSLIIWLLATCSLTRAMSNLDKPRSAFLQDVLESNTADQKYCKLSGEIQDACCDYATVEQTNDALFSALNDIVATPYFRYHKVDLFRECPFWQEDGSCMNRACSVETTEESDVPEAWRSEALGQLKHDSLKGDLAGSIESSVKDSDFCVIDDEADSDGVYVDLLENPERFTGYAGQSSTRVWKAIYEENCFAPVPFVDPARPQAEGGSGFAELNSFGMPSLTSSWGESEKKLMGSLAGPRDGGDEICLEKRVFYRVISGLHASISIHICDDYLDQKTGKWAPNLQCFISRIGEHPERLQNVYFTYVLLLRALSRSGPHLLQTLKDTSSESETVVKLNELIATAKGCPSTFDETSMFSGPSAEILKSEFKDHFRNVSRIMDCVGCDKCRLWGKLQVTGLGTALKLLFSFDNTPVTAQKGASGLSAYVDLKAGELSRGEVVAFVNTLHRLSESLAAVDRFRNLWAHRGDKPAVVDAVSHESGAQAASPTVSSSVSSSTAGVQEVTPLNSQMPSVHSTTGNASAKDYVNGRRGMLDRLLAICKGGWTTCLDLAGSGPARWLSRSEL